MDYDRCQLRRIVILVDNQAAYCLSSVFRASLALVAHVISSKILNTQAQSPLSLPEPCSLTPTLLNAKSDRYLRCKRGSGGEESRKVNAAGRRRLTHSMVHHM